MSTRLGVPSVFETDFVPYLILFVISDSAIATACWVMTNNSALFMVLYIIFIYGKV